MRPIVLFVTGASEIDDAPKVRALVRRKLAPFKNRGVILIHGAAPGVDTFAHELCEEFNITPWPLRFFSHLGKPGGPKRNSAMVRILATLREYGFDCRTFAFPTPTCKGTKHCIGELEIYGFEPDVTELAA